MCYSYKTGTFVNPLLVRGNTLVSVNRKTRHKNKVRTNTNRAEAQRTNQMAYSVLNNSIAGVSRDGEVVGAFKLAHVYQGMIKQVVWENVQGKAIARRDENDEIIRKEVPGITLHFQYKNTANKWSGVIMEDDLTGETMTKGCITIDIPLPKALVTQAKLTQLLLMLRIAKKDAVIELCESELIEDLETEDDMSLEDLESDVDVDDELVDEDLTLENITDDLLNFINRIFTAPFTKSDKGYPIVSRDFSKWVLTQKKPK